MSPVGVDGGFWPRSSACSIVGAEAIVAMIANYAKAASPVGILRMSDMAGKDACPTFRIVTQALKLCRVARYARAAIQDGINHLTRGHLFAVDNCRVVSRYQRRDCSGAVAFITLCDCCAHLLER